ncbi:MAG: hypothetical protein ACI9H6_000185 [Patiriisocius sp.]|jgi:hypothetical protein
MRFEVPQFIEIEDKIFGPFTWKQFVYLCGGVGVGLVTFIATPIFIFILIGLPAGGAAMLLAFYPVNNRPFSVFLESVVRFYNSSRVYHWRKKRVNTYGNDSHTSYEAPISVPIPQKGKGGIHSLSRKLELAALQKEA